MTMPTPPNGKDTKTTPLPAPASGAGTAARPPAAAPAVDLDGYDDDGLIELIEEAKAVLGLRKAKREADFFALIDEQARALGIPPSRLLATLRAKAAGAGPGSGNPEDGRHFVRPLLWNPKDHSQRWSKRGATPKWYVDHLAAGGTEQECIIPPDADLTPDPRRGV